MSWYKLVSFQICCLQSGFHSWSQCSLKFLCRHRHCSKLTHLRRRPCCRFLGFSSILWRAFRPQRYGRALSQVTTSRSILSPICPLGLFLLLRCMYHPGCTTHIVPSLTGARRVFYASTAVWPHANFRLIPTDDVLRNCKSATAWPWSSAST